MVDLHKYTKAELLWIIDRACQLGMDEIYIHRAVCALEHERCQKKLNKADRLSELAHSKTMEYLNLLKPYDGLKISHIPLEVLEKADAAAREARQANQKWKKLMMPKR